uniref:Putative secreted protein n=1 Tax=Rhipicephalus microplus TaxID=6941 RepID=A0A6M2DB25_RHIMP
MFCFFFFFFSECMGTSPMPDRWSKVVSWEVGKPLTPFAVTDHRRSKTFIVNAILCHLTNVYFHSHAGIVRFKLKFVLSGAVICGLDCSP